MKLSRVRISNFRSLRDVDILVSNYMSFVGPNGSGKSSFLYALDWFFGNRQIDDQSLSYNPNSNLISVEVWIDELSDDHKRLFDRFAVNGEVKLAKSYDCTSGATSYKGLAVSGPGFAEVLNCSGGSEMRDAYKSLRDQCEGLEALSGGFGKDKIASAFAAWCGDPSNSARLVQQEGDASSLFDRDGAVSRYCDFILVKGALDFAEEINPQNRNSIVSVLTKSLIDSPKKPIIDAWKEKYSDEITELEKDLIGAVNNSLATVNHTVNSNLSRYDRTISFELTTSESNVELGFPTNVGASVRGKDGRTENLAVQGHGIQRSVIMSMVEALSAKRQIDSSDPENLVIIAAEEPELYQHPVRARSFFRTLRSLADQDGFQVLLATHSPEFVSSDFLDSLRFVRKIAGYTEIKSTSLDAVSKVRGKHPNEVHEWLTKELPKSIASTFFADLVLLTEGETDEALWPEIADLLQLSFDHHGIICVSVGSKTGLVTTRAVLQEFGVPTYLIADGDYCEVNNESQRTQTSQLVSDMDLYGSDGNPLYEYGDNSFAFEDVAILKEKIEQVLEEWPSFTVSMASVNPRGARKKAHHYRMAARMSAVEGMPDILRAVVNHITGAVSVSNHERHTVSDQTNHRLVSRDSGT